VQEFELLVVGSGPGGQRAAIAAAKLGKRVAIVDRKGMVGGVCVNTGTIPSKTLREAVLYLTGTNQRELYGASYQVKEDITVSDLTARTQHVIAREAEVVRTQLQRNHVKYYQGTAQFLDPHTMLVTDTLAGVEFKLGAERIVIATGTRPARPKKVEFDERRIMDSDGVLDMDHIPASMVVVGAGIIGIEYASMFAALGTRVTVVERRDTMIDFVDGELVEALKFHLRDLSVTFRFNEEVESVRLTERATLTTLKSGKRIPAEVVMYSAGRQGVTDNLGLDKAGLSADERGRIKVDDSYRTEADHIYAVGDVIGFPALASTSMEQGRLAAHAAFDEPTAGMDTVLQPIGIYTIPEISYVGRTEAELTESAIPYEVGISRYRELARGQIVGDSYGMLKLLVSPDTKKLLGVHVFGTNATELVHIGQAIMGTGGTIDYLVNAVFNYPTLSETYKVAALDAVNKMRAVARLGIDGFDPVDVPADRDDPLDAEGTV
jgi:NAD(P) transhydrogenase